MQQLQKHEAAPSSSLTHIQGLRSEDGPPLSVGQQLSRRLQPKQFPVVPGLRVNRFDLRLRSDNCKLVALHLGSLTKIHRPNQLHGNDCRSVSRNTLRTIHSNHVQKPDFMHHQRHLDYR